MVFILTSAATICLVEWFLLSLGTGMDTYNKH